MRLGVILSSLLAAIFARRRLRWRRRHQRGESAARSTGRARAAKKRKGGRKKKGKEGEKEKPSPEKAALVKEGDEICSTVPQNYTAKLKALEKKNGGKKPSTKETNLKAAVPPLYTAIEEFEELTAPSGEEAKLAAIVAALEAAAKGLEEKPNRNCRDRNRRSPNSRS